MFGKATIVVGGQYGSEGKGVVVHALAGRRRWGACIRTGGPNAGHTFHAFGRDFKQQMLPCGWPHGLLCCLGAGAVVDPMRLLAEFVEARKYSSIGIEDVIVDGAAVILTEQDRRIEGGVDGALHRSIGSTGEGVGAARIRKIMRDSSACFLASDVRRGQFVVNGVDFRDFVVGRGEVRRRAQLIGDVILEGTQGTGLSLHHGQWPFVTSHDTTASTIAGDAGFGPHDIGEVILVLRTYPIRVAGNSGPLYEELDWDEMSRLTGRKTIERTTVTHKIRRVGRFDDDLARMSAMLNSPDWIFLTFADYVAPDAVGITRWDDLPWEVLDFVQHVEEVCKVPVGAVGTGRRDSSQQFGVAWRWNP